MVIEEIMKEREELIARLEELRNQSEYTAEDMAEIERIEARLAELAELADELKNTTPVDEPKAGRTMKKNTMLGTLARKWRDAGHSEKTTVSVEAKASGNTGAMVSPEGFSDAENLFCGAGADVDIFDLFTVVDTDRDLKYVTWKFTQAGTTSCAGLKKQIVGTPTAIENNATKVAGYISVAECMLEDDPALEADIRGELADEIAMERARQVFNGDGEGTNLKGLLYTDGVAQVTHSATGGWIDDIIKAIATVQSTTGTQPTDIIVSPDVWEAIVGARISDALVFPRAVTDGVNNVSPWGLRMQVSSTVPAGTAIVGDFKSAKVYRRSQLRVDAGYTDDNFIYDIVTLRGYQRLSFVVPCPQKFVVIK